jgi:hypothetical protein
MEKTYASLGPIEFQMCSEICLGSLTTYKVNVGIDLMLIHAQLIILNHSSILNNFATDNIVVKHTQTKKDENKTHS